MVRHRTRQVARNRRRRTRQRGGARAYERGFDGHRIRDRSHIHSCPECRSKALELGGYQGTKNPKLKLGLTAAAAALLLKTLNQRDGQHMSGAETHQPPAEPYAETSNVPLRPGAGAEHEGKEEFPGLVSEGATSLGAADAPQYAKIDTHVQGYAPGGL